MVEMFTMTAQDAQYRSRAMVFLDGVDVTDICMEATVPVEPNIEAQGSVVLATRDASGKILAAHGQVLRDTYTGIVSWRWKE